MTCDGVAGQGFGCNHSVKEYLKGDTGRLCDDFKIETTMLATYLAAIPRLFDQIALGARLFGGLQSD